MVNNVVHDIKTCHIRHTRDKRDMSVENCLLETYFCYQRESIDQSGAVFLTVNFYQAIVRASPAVPVHHMGPYFREMCTVVIDEGQIHF